MIIVSIRPIVNIHPRLTAKHSKIKMIYRINKRKVDAN